MSGGCSGRCARNPFGRSHARSVEIYRPARTSSHNCSQFPRNVECGGGSGRVERAQCRRANAPSIVITAPDPKGVYKMVIERRACKCMLAFVLMLFEIPLFGQGQTLSKEELRTQVEQRYSVLPIQNGIVLSPKNKNGIVSIE